MENGTGKKSPFREKKETNWNDEKNRQAKRNLLTDKCVFRIIIGRMKDTKKKNNETFKNGCFFRY